MKESSGWGSPESSKGKLLQAIDFIKNKFVDSIEHHFIEDIAFIGNASKVYHWEPCFIVDLDVCLFLKNINHIAGTWLLRMEKELQNHFNKIDIEFEFRNIRGPYKPTPEVVNHPFIVAHGAIFTEKTYIEESSLLRWSWRKYECIVEHNRLKRLAPSKIDVNDFFLGKLGIKDRLESILDGKLKMEERTLPSLSWTTIEFDVNSSLFTEYCFDSGATIARSHARILGKQEADILPNNEFFQWYHDNIFQSSELMQLITMKLEARNSGYLGKMHRARNLAIKYLSELYSYLIKKGMMY